jgi:hypothetical protein
MARNGSGDFSLLATLAPANTVSNSTSVNSIMVDIALALTESINKDGTKAWVANQSLGGNKFTSVGDGTARTDSIAFGQVQDGKANWVVAGGTADALTATYAPAITVLGDGQECYVRAGFANATTTPTFAPNGLTARTIVKEGGNALVAGSIKGADHELHLRYKLASTRWELLNPSDGGTYTVNGQTEETTTALGDFLGGYDLSGTAERKFSIQNLLKAINLLTEDTSPDEAADFLLSYDASASDVKKVKPSNLAIGAPTSISKAASQAVTSTTLTNDTHLTFSIAASTKYIGKFVLDPSHTQAENFKFAITGPASPTKVTYGVSSVAEETLPGTTNNLIAPNPATAFATTVVVTMGGGGATIGAIVIDFLIENGSNAGTVTLQWANNATATSRSLSANSYVWYQVAN